MFFSNWDICPESLNWRGTKPTFKVFQKSKEMLTRIIWVSVLKSFAQVFPLYRSIHSQMFFKIGVLKYFSIFTGKHLCWSLFLIKFISNFLKKRLQHRCFPMNIVKFLRIAFSIEHFLWLLLTVYIDITL